MRIPFAIPPPKTRPFDVAGFGRNSIDLVAVVTEHPRSNSKQPLQRFAKLAGGEVATALSVCARLGWTAKYVGSFGDDDLGEMGKESLRAAGVDISASRTVPGATNQFAIVLIDIRSGERSILWDRHPALTMQPEDVPRDAVTAGRMLLVDCGDPLAASEAARFARDAGSPTVVDVERVRPGTEELLKCIDAIIAAESFPSELTGYSETGRALRALADEFQAPLVCVTLGAAGSLALVDGEEIRTPGFAVDCVDSTGAGDAFRGGFIAGCLRQPDGPIADALAYANAVAAMNCRALGARGGMPTASEVEHFMGASLLPQSHS